MSALTSSGSLSDEAAGRLLSLLEENDGPLPFCPPNEPLFRSKLLQVTLHFKLCDRWRKHPFQLPVVIILREADMLAGERSEVEFEPLPVIEALVEKAVHAL